MSPAYPHSTAVFDLDSVAMIQLAHTCLNAGVDFGSSPLGKQPDPRMHFTIGTGFEPEALNPRGVGTTPTEDCPGRGLRHDPTGFPARAAGPAGKVPGPVCVPGRGDDSRQPGTCATHEANTGGSWSPDVILDRLAKFNSPADQAKVGQDIAVEQIQWVRRAGWDGLYLMSPGAGAVVLSVLQAGLA